ncbi:hypothetical protein VIGAN_08294300 [Vigna angularis var. angularis]|uniref:Uncharacterized protein n=1 Tax=Vigna angularis var. angularis TaxID=157739 RepID=A0A0S3STE8_PHAAN|nr:hypothetical protein VIGAN_08294300 [Vigna angularis var. angularis]
MRAHCYLKGPHVKGLHFVANLSLILLVLLILIEAVTGVGWTDVGWTDEGWTDVGCRGTEGDEEGRGWVGGILNSSCEVSGNTLMTRALKFVNSALKSVISWSRCSSACVRRRTTSSTVVVEKEGWFFRVPPLDVV